MFVSKMPTAFIIHDLLPLSHILTFYLKIDTLLIHMKVGFITFSGVYAKFASTHSHFRVRESRVYRQLVFTLERTRRRTTTKERYTLICCDIHTRIVHNTNKYMHHGPRKNQPERTGSRRKPLKCGTLDGEEIQLLSVK